MESSMTKADIKILMNELRQGKTYEDVEDTPLHGLALDDFPDRKTVRKEAIVQFLNWQTRCLNGTIDEEALVEHIALLQAKKVVMV